MCAADVGTAVSRTTASDPRGNGKALPTAVRIRDGRAFLGGPHVTAESVCRKGVLQSPTPTLTAERLLLSSKTAPMKTG